MYKLQIKLSTEQNEIVQLCRDYWAVEDGKFAFTVKQLAENFKLKTGEVAKLVAENSEAYSQDYVCHRCKRPFIFENRASYQNSAPWPGKERICNDCQREISEILRTQRALELERQRKAVQKSYPLVPRSEPDVKSLSLEDAVSLLSFIRVSASENLKRFASLESANQRLTPTTDYTVEVLKCLYRSNLIFVHPDSPLEAFDFQEGEPYQFELLKVSWALASGENHEETAEFIVKLESVLRNPELRPAEWNEQILAFWRKIALQECIEYLNHVLEQHNLPFSAGEKTRLVLSSLLETYSVAQIYVMIWSSGMQAAAFYQRGGVTRNHAANTVVSRLQTYGERAIAEGWNVKSGRRDYDCPQTMMSHVLFNTVLKIKDAGFNEKPRLTQGEEDLLYSDSPTPRL